MKLEQWVIFIDMLGYRDVNGRIDDLDAAQEFIAFMKSNQDVITQQNRDEIKEMYAGLSFNLYEYYEIQTAFISDSIIINFLPKDGPEINENRRLLHSASTLVIIIDRIQQLIYKCMSEKNIVFRGGVSNKFCLIESSYGVGEGLAEAYKYESEVSKHPRISICDDIKNNVGLINAFNFICSKIYKRKFLVTDGKDDVVFLDYLGFNIAAQPLVNAYNASYLPVFLAEHKKSIEKNIADIVAKINDANDQHDEKHLAVLTNIRAKYEWMKDYHNNNIGEDHEEFIIN